MEKNGPIYTCLAFCFLATVPERRTAVAHQPAPVDEYAIHADGGIVYDPLRREAQSSGQLDAREKVATSRHRLTLPQWELQIELPEQAAAYDVIPIRYRLAGKAVVPVVAPVAVEAVAFEASDRRKGRHLYDLALPGPVDLDVEYLGSITAHMIPGARHNLEPNLSDTPKTYPPFKRGPFVRSGIVEAGDLVWFKFRYTNTGQTILDPEGFGGCQFYPELYRKDDKGEYQLIGYPYNLYYRDLEYFYPGESREIWFQFMTHTPPETPQNVGLVPGEYRIRFRMTYRYYKSFGNPFVNIWDGPPLYAWEMPIRVASTAQQAEVASGQELLTDGGDADKITRYIHTFEEFMTAFDVHQKPTAEKPIEGVLHLQVAPWTNHVVVKLISADPLAIATVEVPLQVGSVPDIACPMNPATMVMRNGKLQPIIYSQTMADMRTNVQLGPFPEQHIRERMREMMDCGINVVACTAMPWLYDDRRKPIANHQGDAWKYALDLTRVEGLQVEGWGAYPFDRGVITDIAEWISGRPFKLATRPGGDISHSDPRIAEANAAAILYQFDRWGDLYMQSGAGSVPISVGEDTRGWLRDDVNTRLPMGKLTIREFREWLKGKYGSAEKVNAAWGSRFASLDQIDPEAGQAPNPFGHRWEYTVGDHAFHDWNAAVEDLDRFRTELRVRNYRDTLDRIRKQIPNAAIVLRTEGANVLVGGLDPASSNAHERHIYYSQRRCGAIAEIIAASRTVGFHSDYTTMPYTPAEIRKFVRAAVGQGIIPAWLPQFDNMRDIAINDRYGNDYQIHYNLPQPKKGLMMHRLVALYPWSRAVVGSGGIPGILWEDYQCDGFATETQKREMRLFSSKLRETAASSLQVHIPQTQPSQQWRRGSKSKLSYRITSP